MFNPATYTPGDAWTSSDFFTLAATPPRIELTSSDAEAATESSYFESRSPRGNERYVDVSVSGAGTFVVDLQRSTDGGSTWRTVKIYEEPTEESYAYRQPDMLRLQIVSATDPVTLRLYQYV